MKFKRKILFPSLIMMSCLFMVMNSCKKDENETTPAVVVSNPTAIKYFIEGKVNNVMVRAEYYGLSESSNSNFNGFMHMITMQRTVSETDGRGWYMNIDNVNLDNWQVPDTLDASQLSDKENLRLSYYSGVHESENNFLVDNVVLGNNSFQMIVSSKSGDIIQGTFHGKLRNGSDSQNTVTVTEGKFNVKISRR